MSVCLIAMGILFFGNVYCIQAVENKEAEKDIMVIKSGSMWILCERTDELSEQVLSEMQPEIEKAWGTLASNDYLDLLERQQETEEILCAKLVKRHSLESYLTNLKKVCVIHGADGEVQELYIIQHITDSDLSSPMYSGIMYNPANDQSRILFQADVQWGIKVSMDEFYDVQIVDVDGNGKEDIILLLGEHLLTGESYMPQIYCLIGLQEEGGFQFITNHDEEWLERTIEILYDDSNENRKISNILSDLKQHWGNGDVQEDAAGKEMEDYIWLKEKMIEKKLDERSAYFERELLLWEYFYTDSNNGLQSIKIYKEHGDRGKARGQIVAYIFDYSTEEAEKQAVPEVYTEITGTANEYSTDAFQDVELVEIEYEDRNGDGEKDIYMIVEFTLNLEKEVKERYCITFLYEPDEENHMKIFNRVEYEKES